MGWPQKAAAKFGSHALFDRIHQWLTACSCAFHDEPFDVVYTHRFVMSQIDFPLLLLAAIMLGKGF